MTARTDRLRALLAERILVLDGATGTYLQGRNLGPADFGGEAYDGCNEHLVLTRPDVVREMHEGYLAAGADLVETDTFGGTRIPLAEYGLAHKVREINATAARLAREACARFETPDRPRFVAGSMGPGTKTISVTGGITFGEVAAAFAEQTVGLVEGGADVLFLETQQDTLNVKAALLGIDRGFAEAGQVLPVVLSVSIEAMGTMLAGQSIEAVYVSVAHRDLLAIGMNCATGPDFMTDHLRTLAQISRFPVSCFPNAGLPDEEGRYNETPELFVRKVERFLAEGWVNILGGCCRARPRARRARRPPSPAHGGARPPDRRLGHRRPAGRRRPSSGHRRRADERHRQPEVQGARRRRRPRPGRRARPPAGPRRRPDPGRLSRQPRP